MNEHLLSINLQLLLLSNALHWSLSSPVLHKVSVCFLQQSLVTATPLIIFVAGPSRHFSEIGLHFPSPHLPTSSHSEVIKCVGSNSVTFGGNLLPLSVLISTSQEYWCVYFKHSPLLAFSKQDCPSTVHSAAGFFSGAQ